MYCAKSKAINFFADAVEEDLYDLMQEWCDSALAVNARENSQDNSIDKSQRISILENIGLLASAVETVKSNVKSLKEETKKQITRLRYWHLSQLPTLQPVLGFFLRQKQAKSQLGFVIECRMEE